MFTPRDLVVFHVLTRPHALPTSLRFLQDSHNVLLVAAILLTTASVSSIWVAASMAHAVDYGNTHKMRRGLSK